MKLIRQAIQRRNVRLRDVVIHQRRQIRRGQAGNAFARRLHDQTLTRFFSRFFPARDKIIAHFDLEYGEGEFHEKRYVLHPSEVELRLRVDGFDIRTNFTTLPPGRISEVNQLLAFQIERIEQCQTDSAISVLKETKGKIGSYIFIPAKKKSS